MFPNRHLVVVVVVVVVVIIIYIICVQLFDHLRKNQKLCLLYFVQARAPIRSLKNTRLCRSSVFFPLSYSVCTKNRWLVFWFFLRFFFPLSYEMKTSVSAAWLMTAVEKTTVTAVIKFNRDDAYEVIWIIIHNYGREEQPYIILHNLFC